MIEKAKIEEKVKEFILKTSYLPENQVQSETLIFAEGIMDSMGFISIINFIEETFDVTADDDELIDSNFESISAITDFVERKLLKKG
ncbi:MAG: acyl carrier protein [Prolixibacteraceae bacterium]|nr:acyl carrier protein [Prolixibacteraceae bacterium]